MRHLLLSLGYAALLPGLLTAQVRMVLQDNWEIPSDTWIKIIPDTYHVSDVARDGVIQIVNKSNVIIDGDSVVVHGNTFSGYFILIVNSENVVIRNFRCVDSMYYALFARNSRHIQVVNCNFSGNRKDSIGYINVWTDVDQALGGGVLMDSCSSSTASGNVMKNSNDGIALYHCDSITVNDNDLSWNTSYGIRMYWTNGCSIHHNICSHTNRLTDQSDCGAILLIVSNENRVEHNDLTYSGDGIFLGQYQYSTIPNNNYFAYNDGSYSPHNAFEATFASGNVFTHNRANYSDYGFWLGYSFNTIVDSSEITNNQTAGIAVDRGFQNSFSNDSIAGNPVGIWLWEGSAIPPYSSWSSQDYLITQCVLTGNGTAVSASNTKFLGLQSDSIAYNANGIHMDGSATGGQIEGCSFSRNVLFHIENASPDDIEAMNNAFGVNDTLLIGAKIYDRQDNPAVGIVIWKPFRPGPVPVFQFLPPADLTEPPSLWTVYASDGRRTTAEWDSVNVKSGRSALRITTESGFDVMIQYWPEGNEIGSWDLSSTQYLTVWFKAANIHPFQAQSIRLGNESGGYFSYDAPSTILSSAVGAWKQFTVPLTGDATWQRTTHGAVSLTNISYVQIHADTWDSGFTLWIDGLSFGPVQDVERGKPGPAEFSLSQNYPNPFNPSTEIRFRVQGTGYEVQGGGYVTLKVYDILGREVTTLVNEKKPSGEYVVRWNAGRSSSGMYIYRMETSSGKTYARTMVLVK
jgi:parallel beta-helix repeat protein